MRARVLVPLAALAAAGAAAVAAAQSSGMWTMMDDVEDLVVPPDLADAFAEQGWQAPASFAVTAAGPARRES